jgi:molybdopterin-guanine dinucleotide biosynthesis protein B
VGAGRSFTNCARNPSRNSPPFSVDLVIVEGFKAYGHPKIEVYRAANGRPFLFGNVANVCAIAADGAIADAPVPVVHLDDIGAIADQALAAAMPIREVIAGLEAAPPVTGMGPVRTGRQP